jgi:hypothetical protein
MRRTRQFGSGCGPRTPTGRRTARPALPCPTPPRPAPPHAPERAAELAQYTDLALRVQDVLRHALCSQPRDVQPLCHALAGELLAGVLVRDHPAGDAEASSGRAYTAPSSVALQTALDVPDQPEASLAEDLAPCESLVKVPAVAAVDVLLLLFRSLDVPNIYAAAHDSRASRRTGPRASLITKQPDGLRRTVIDYRLLIRLRTTHEKPPGLLLVGLVSTVVVVGSADWTGSAASPTQSGIGGGQAHLESFPYLP